MVVYIARCKSIAEAAKVQSRLMAACPTLIYTRMLRRVDDLDAYNAEMLRSADEQTALGELTFHAGERPLRQRPPFLLIALLSLIGLGALGFAIVGPLVFFGFAALAVFGIGAMAVGSARGRPFGNIPADRQAFWKAEKWLRRGRPVVVAGSDEPPVDGFKLPANIHCFVRQNTPRHNACKSMRA